MSTYIEKLKLPANPLLYSIENDVRIRLTMVDFLLGDHTLGYYNYQPFPYKTSLIKDGVVNKLAQHNIHLGKFFNVDGIDIEILLANSWEDQYIIEIPLGHLQYYQTNQLVELADRYKIIMTDIEEGNNHTMFWWGPNQKHIMQGTFREFVLNSKINEKNIYLASSRFERVRVCKEIHLYGLWVVLQSLTTPFVIDIIENNNKQKYLDIIEKKSYEKFAVFPNWRARYWRVILLSLLNEKHLLEHIDWSLIGEYTLFLPNHDYKNFNRQFFTKYTSERRLGINNYDEITNRFFDKYQHQLPKFLYGNESDNVMTYMYLPEEDIKKYKFSITIERPWLTEKTVKSFLRCSSPIILYPYKNCTYLDKIRSMGFKIEDLGLNKQASGDNVVENAATLVENLYNSSAEPNLDDIINNFELCVDKEKLENYLIQPLVEAFK